MRTSVLACVLALGATTALAGESPYNPPSDPQHGAMDGCSRMVAQAQAELGRAHAANRPKAESFLKEARAAMKAGQWQQCAARAQDAMHWEQ
jgi:hypothetical protein